LPSIATSDVRTFLDKVFISHQQLISKPKKLPPTVFP
jgi:hypothetical protein